MVVILIACLFWARLDYHTSKTIRQLWDARKLVVWFSSLCRLYHFGVRTNSKPWPWVTSSRDALVMIIEPILTMFVKGVQPPFSVLSIHDDSQTYTSALLFHVGPLL